MTHVQRRRMRFHAETGKGALVYSVSLSPNYDVMAVGVHDGLVIKHVHSFNTVLDLQLDTAVLCVSWSPEQLDKRIAVGCQDGSIRVFAYDSQDEQVFAIQLDDPVTAIAWESNQASVKIIAAGTRSGKLHLCFDSGMPIGTYPLEAADEITSLNIAHELGSMMVSASNGSLFEVDTSLLRDHHEAIAETVDLWGEMQATVDTLGQQSRCLAGKWKQFMLPVKNKLSLMADLIEKHGEAISLQDCFIELLMAGKQNQASEQYVEQYLSSRNLDFMQNNAKTQTTSVFYAISNTLLPHIEILQQCINSINDVRSPLYVTLNITSGHFDLVTEACVQLYRATRQLQHQSLISLHRYRNVIAWLLALIHDDAESEAPVYQERIVLDFLMQDLGMDRSDQFLQLLSQTSTGSFIPCCTALDREFNSVFTHLKDAMLLQLTPRRVHNPTQSPVSHMSSGQQHYIAAITGSLTWNMWSNEHGGDPCTYRLVYPKGFQIISLSWYSQEALLLLLRHDEETRVLLVPASNTRDVSPLSDISIDMALHGRLLVTSSAQRDLVAVVQGNQLALLDMVDEE